jgi:hypothetical protein
MAKQLEGVQMELQDGAFPLVTSTRHSLARFLAALPGTC